MTEAYLYKPSAWGELFHNTRVHELLGAGSAGPGKTEVLLNDANEQIFTEHQRCAQRDHPFPLKWGDSKGWALHLRRTVKQLEQTMNRSHRIFPRIDPDAHWDAQKSTWTFSSGYHYQFGHCKDPNDWENYYSNEYTWLGFDELTQFEEEQYDQIRSRLRTDDPVLSGMLRCVMMSNPVIRREKGEDFTVKNPHWVREKFVDPAPEGKVLLKKRIVMEDGEIKFRTRMYLPATLWDNPNKAFVRQYEETLQGMKPHIRQALLKGDWYVSPDAFWSDCWDKQIHICRPFKIPIDWPQFRSMDWGFKSPGCVHWYAMDPDENLFVTRELTFQGRTDVEVANMVREVEFSMGLWQGKKSLITGPADTQLWEERGEHSQKTKAQTFAEKGIYWHRAEKARQHNAEQITKRLMDHSNKKTTPGLVIFTHCKNLIRTLPMVPTDPKNSEVPLDGGEDHWVDSLGYGCAFASRGKAGIGRAVRKKDPWEIDDEDKPARPPSRGRTGYGA